MTNLCKLNEILFDHVIKTSWCRIYLSFFKIVLLVFVLFSCRVPVVKPLQAEIPVTVEVLKDLTIDVIETWTEEDITNKYYQWESINTGLHDGSHYSKDGKTEVVFYNYNQIQLREPGKQTNYQFKFKDENTLICYYVISINNNLNACIRGNICRITTFKKNYDGTFYIFGIDF